MSAVTVALWTVFWILAIFVASLIISLVIAAFIRAGGSGGESDRVPPERPDPDSGERAPDEEPR